MGCERKGPTVKRQYACPACGHWQHGKSSFQARPIAYRDVIYVGGRRPKGDTTTKVGFFVSKGGERARDAVTQQTRVCDGVVYVDQVRDGGEFLTRVKLVIGRLAEVLGLILASESKLRVELDLKKIRLVQLERRIAELVDRLDAARAHHEPKRATMRAGARRMASLGGTPVQARPGPRRQDGLDIMARPRRILSAAVEAIFRPAQPVAVRAGRKSEDGL